MFFSFVASLIMMVSLFIVALTPDQQSYLNAVVVGVVGLVLYFNLAKDGGLALIVGLCKSVLSLSLSFGLQLPADKQAAIMSFVAVTTAMFVHSNVTAPIDENGKAVAQKDT